MVRDRKELGKILRTIMDGKGKVYFSPPPDFTMEYPCIIYDLENANVNYADDKPYLVLMRYTVTYISKSADNQETINKLLEIPRCSFSRSFNSDHLRHYVFNLYY